VNIDWVTEMDKPDTIPDANTNPENLDIIKALSDRQIKTKFPWSADFIKDKGEGVVVLLHGQLSARFRTISPLLADIVDTRQDPLELERHIP
jgi:hypothetical protein